MPSLVQSILARASRYPGESALIWRQERISYGDLAAMVESAHTRLYQPELIGAGCVALVAKKSPQSIATLIALLSVGRPVLLPAVDLGALTLDTLLRRAGCTHVLDGDAGVARRLDGGGELGPDPIAFLLTTSGSTGVPKIVPLPVAAVERFTAWAAGRFDIGPGTTVLSYAPLNFDLCLLDVWTTLKRGGCVALVDQDRATNPRHLLDVLSNADVRVVQGVPMLYHLLAGVPAGFPSVRHAVFTGEVLPRRTLERLPGLFPNARLSNVYGCTETNDSFVHEVERDHLPAGAVPIGRPLPGVHVLVVDREDRGVDGAGEGELLVATPFQTPGYLGGAGNDRFTVRGDGRTYFRTGDLVRRDGDGVFTLIGRDDFQVKVRGVRVDLAAIEAVLLEHAGVAEAVVVALPDDAAGRRLAAAVRRVPGADVDELELRAHCAQRLARAAIPSAIRIGDVPLPRTSTGKFDRPGIARTLAGKP